MLVELNSFEAHAQEKWWTFDAKRGCVPSEALSKKDFQYNPENLLKYLPECKIVSQKEEETGILIILCEKTAENSPYFVFFGDSIKSCKKIPKYSKIIMKELNRKLKVR